MQWHKVLPFLMLAPIALAAPSKEASQKAAQQKLVKIAATIQNYEAQLSAVEHDLNQACAEESAILEELDHHNQRLMETIHYLRHATQYSPLLAMLSAPKPEDVIHSSLLLRSITPEIHIRNQQLLEKVKTLSHIRAQLEAKQNQLRDITFHYHQERENLDVLLENHPQTAAPMEENFENPLEVLTLIPPVAGKLIPTYKNSNPEWAPFTQGILFQTRHGAQVVSPISGKISCAEEYTKGQGKIVIIETPNSHVVISGLGTLNDNLERKIEEYAKNREKVAIVAGEPIGRMRAKRSSKAMVSEQTTQRLYLEVWQQEQTIDPQTVLKGQKE